MERDVFWENDSCRIIQVDKEMLDWLKKNKVFGTEAMIFQQEGYFFIMEYEIGMDAMGHKRWETIYNNDARSPFHIFKLNAGSLKKLIEIANIVVKIKEEAKAGT